MRTIAELEVENNQLRAEVERKLAVTECDRNQEPNATLGSHPEDFCKVCGGENPVWFVNSKLWNKFHGPYSIICPRCFMLMARQQGYDRVWEIKPEGGLVIK